MIKAYRLLIGTWILGLPEFLLSIHLSPVSISPLLLREALEDGKSTCTRTFLTGLEVVCSVDAKKKKNRVKMPQR